MRTARLLYAMMRADFQERTRRYSFLMMLLAVVFLGYSVNSGTIQLYLGEYRGVYNSAWVGGMMTLVIVTFLGWFGFYLVKNGIERDERTGVGQIIATTPLRKVEYTLGKWLSNFALLAALCVVLLLAAVLLQIMQREDTAFDLWALAAPFLFVALPLLALVAALAVWFETIPFLKGGFGNLVYFFLFIFMMVFSIEKFGRDLPTLEPLGLRLITSSMAEQLKQIDPTYNVEDFTLGMLDHGGTKVFRYTGMRWPLDLIATRLSWILISALLAAAAALPFNRFDPSTFILPRLKTRRAKPVSAPEETVLEDAAPSVPVAPVKAASFSASGVMTYHNNFARLVMAELRLLLRGLRWYWYAGAGILLVGTLASPLEVVRIGWLPAVAIWPVFLWSQLGVREQRWNTGQIIFSAPRPLMRLMLPAWLAGVLLALALGSGALLQFLWVGDLPGALAVFLAALFIPGLALALGTWSGSSKLFEVLYLLLWYLGPLNRVAALDYIGVAPDGLARAQPLLLLAAALFALALAIAGRRQQLMK